MKKILVLSLLLVLVATGLSAAVVGTGSLNVFGKIGAGNIEFSVNQTLIAANRIDLINNVDVQSDGGGVEIGNWEFDALNQAAGVAYTVTYTYSPLAEGLVSIPYELLIDDGVNPVSVKATTQTTTFSSTPGNYNIVRDVLVRLTSAGETAAAAAPASLNYNSTVTVELTNAL